MAEQNIGCLHDYTLTSKDVRLLNDAAVLVINGAGMESFVEDAYKNVEDFDAAGSAAAALAQAQAYTDEALTWGVIAIS